MAHPLHHAESSARKFGGVPSDYQAVHDWFDASKEHLALFTHRALRHHALGLFEAERVFVWRVNLSETPATIRMRFYVAASVTLSS